MLTADAQQHDAWHGALPAKDQIAEILVLGKQKPSFARPEQNNICIAQTSSGLGDIEYVVTGGAQKPNQVGRDAFVSEPPHASAVDNFFVGEIVGGKCLRGAYIVQCQPWVVRKDCFMRYTGAELAQDQLYGNACATNDRFAVHNIRIYFDALILHGILFDQFRP